MLNFTNQSRSYDATRHAVRFWGYDGALEVSFFVTDEALRHLQPGASADETSLLAVFEAHHDRVLRAAARVYARGRKGIVQNRSQRRLTVGATPHLRAEKDTEQRVETSETLIAIAAVAALIRAAVTQGLLKRALIPLSACPDLRPRLDHLTPPSASALQAPTTALRLAEGGGTVSNN